MSWNLFEQTTSWHWEKSRWGQNPQLPVSERKGRKKNLINIKLHRAALETSRDDGSRGRTFKINPLVKCSETVQAFIKYQENSDLHFFQFDYTVRTEPETWEPVMKHPPTDIIIANTVITPLTRALNTLPNVTTPGMDQGNRVKNRGEHTLVATTVA